MHLFDVYVKINNDVVSEEANGEEPTTDRLARDVFRKMEAGTLVLIVHSRLLTRTTGDEATLTLWRRFRDLSIKKYEEVYRRLNVYFDVYAGESLVESTRIDAARTILESKGLLTTKTAEESKHDWDRKRADMVVSTAETQSQANTTSAESQDLALAVDLSEWKLGKPVLQKSGKS